MDGAERDAGAVVFERGVLKTERREQFALDKASRRFRITASGIADQPRQQHEIAVGVPPLRSARKSALAAKAD